MSLPEAHLRGVLIGIGHRRRWRQQPPFQREQLWDGKVLAATGDGAGEEGKSTPRRHA